MRKQRRFSAILLTALLLGGALPGLFACGEVNQDAETTGASIEITEVSVDDTQAYAPIIAAYSNFLRDAKDADMGIAEGEFIGAANIPGEFDYAVESSLAEIRMGGWQALGYSVYDINNDGTPELIVRSEDFFTIYSIFTLHDGKPVLLGAYWSRSRCMLAAHGTLYYHGSNGADDSVSLILTLPPGRTAFEEEEADPIEYGPYSPYNPMALDFIPIT